MAEIEHLNECVRYADHVKLRYGVTCERCKKPIPFGGSAVRYHRRYWHYQCVAAHIEKRQDVRGVAH
jgi:hypothetical protein